MGANPRISVLGVKQCMGILTAHQIRQSVNAGHIVITPYNVEHINITSYDLTLGKYVRVYDKWTKVPDVAEGSVITGEELFPNDEILDVKEEPATHKYKIGEQGILLKPGVCYLMHTEEMVTTSSYNPILDGKSSIGRLFMTVHETAGYGDPGFVGQYTLEVTVHKPLRVYAGMRICQVRFHLLAETAYTQYQGNYTGKDAQGPVGSKAWKQFT